MKCKWMWMMCMILLVIPFSSADLTPDAGKDVSLVDKDGIPVLSDSNKSTIGEETTTTFTLNDKEAILSEIKIEGIDNSGSLYYDEISNTEFAIDPSELLFKQIIVSKKIATSNYLKKCSLWNMTARSCMGNWIVIQELTIGEPYTVIITDPADPGFGEINLTEAIHLDTDKSIIGDITVNLTYRDDNLSTIINEGEYVNFSFDSNLTYGNFIYTSWVNASSTFVLDLFDSLWNLIERKTLSVSDSGAKYDIPEGVEEDKFYFNVSSGWFDIDYLIDPANGMPFFDGFETGTFDTYNWTVVSSASIDDPWTIKSFLEYEGSYAVRGITDAGQSTNMSTNISTVGYTDIHLDLYYQNDHFEYPIEAIIWYYNGTDWNNITNIPDVGLVWTNFNTTLPSDADNNPDFKIKFTQVGGSTNQDGWFDNIAITGTTVPPTISNLTLNSTFGTNLTTENLTAYWDVSAGSVYNITDWRIDGTSIAVLNMPFEAHGNSATKAIDYSTNSNNGTVTGATFTSTGGYDGGGAYEFDGAGDYIVMTHTTEQEVTAGTWVAWINPDSSSDWEDIFISKHETAEAYNGVSLFMGGTGTLSVQIKNATSTVLNTGDIGSDIRNKWSHVALLFNQSDGGDVSLYIDGTLAYNGTVSGAWDFNSNDLWLGYSIDTYWDEFIGKIDSFQFYSRILSIEQIIALNNSRNDIIVSNETILNDIWQTCITGNDGTQDGNTTCSNNLTIAPAGDTLSVNFDGLYSLNSSNLYGGSFNTSNLEEIEYMVTNFTVTTTGTIDDWYLNYTALGTGGCAVGNLQSSQCYNYSNNNWITVRNGTITSTYDSTQGNQGDRIILTRTGNTFSYKIDEHYNPNIMKWYNALYNFSDVKWQDGPDKKITKNNMIRVNLQNVVPLDADQYKLDFRVNCSSSPPTQPLLAYGCNSSYVSGAPTTSNGCILIASKTCSELQDDGTKFRGIFTKHLVDELGDGKYIVLDTDEANPTKYYSIKTYKALNLSHSIKWDYSTDHGNIWTQNADGYESEMNINWFYNGGDPTGIIFEFWANTTTGVSNSIRGNMTWDIDPSQNYAPLVSIINPKPNETIANDYNITFTILDPNDDNLNATLYLYDGAVLNQTIATDMNQSNTSVLFPYPGFSGRYNLTLTVCELGTSDLFCVNDTHEINFNSIPTINNNSIRVNGALQPSIDPIENSINTISITFNVTDLDGYSDINTSSTFINISLGATTKYNGTLDSTCSGNVCVFNGSFDMDYYDPAGIWDIDVGASDDEPSSAIGYNNFTYNTLSAIQLLYSPINWSNINGVGDTNTTPTNLSIFNSGNAQYDVNLTASLLIGQTWNDDNISLSNLKWDIDSDASDGTTIISEQIIQSSLNGSQIKPFWYYISIPTGLKAQIYNASWIFSIN